MQRATYGNVLAGLLVALVIGLGCNALLTGAGMHGHSVKATEQTAVMTAAAVAEAVESVVQGGGPDTQVQTVVAKLQGGLSAINSIRVVDVKRRQVLASTITADAPDGVLPRKLQRSEKSWYDEGRSLRAAHKTNLDEGKARKREILASVDSLGAVVLVLPLEYDHQINGTVTVSVAAEPTDLPGRSKLALVSAVVAFVLMLVLGRLVPAGLPLLLLLAVLLLMVFAMVNWTGFRDLDQGRLAVEEVVARAGDNLQQEVQTLDMPSSVAGADSWLQWDLNVFRTPRAMHSFEGGVDEAAVQADFALARGRFQQGQAGLFVLALAIGGWVALGWAVRTWRALFEYHNAYAFVLPAMIGMVLLVFFPFAYGVLLSFTNQTILNLDKPLYELWAGLDNFVQILTDFDLVTRSESGTSMNYMNFYWTLGFTIVWTVTNVTLGVSLGLFLALILNTPGLKLRPIYRVLLILPWAVPNYITALIWRGMFHQQFGVINQVIQVFGGDPIAWFDQPLTSFLAVLATNGWLSFPFMMVVSLGALQSIPGDLYEAARVDGASKWQQFTLITLPSLKPALVPAIILSVVWTFNMFNIIYLVSAGAPAGATEILITDAYKIAFEQYRYGYAAAYSVVIFMILLFYGTWQNRVTQATEGV